MSKHWNPQPYLPPRGVFGLNWGELRLMLVVGVMGGLGMAVYFSGSGEAADDIPSSGYVDVIDGDTFRYGGQTIRIADIDTPEVDGRCAYESDLAARATERMEMLLHEGYFVLEPIARDEDQYGRKLRIVTRGGRSLGDQMVAEGLARTWTGRREPWCS